MKYRISYLLCCSYLAIQLCTGNSGGYTILKTSDAIFYELFDNFANVSQIKKA